MSLHPKTFKEAVAQQQKSEERKARKKSNAAFILKVSGKKKLPAISTLQNKLWDLDTMVVRRRDGPFCRSCVYRIAFLGGTVKSNLGYTQCHIIPQCEGPGIVYDLSNKYFGCEACNASEKNFRVRWTKAIFPAMIGQEAYDELWRKARQASQLRRPDYERMIAERQEMLARGVFQ